MHLPTFPQISISLFSKRHNSNPTFLKAAQVSKHSNPIHFTISQKVYSFSISCSFNMHDSFICFHHAGAPALPNGRIHSHSLKMLVACDFHSTAKNRTLNYIKRHPAEKIFGPLWLNAPISQGRLQVPFFV